MSSIAKSPGDEVVMQMYLKHEFNPVMPCRPSCYLTKKVGVLFIQITAGGTRYIYLNSKFKESGKAEQKSKIIPEVQVATIWKDTQSQTGWSSNTKPNTHKKVSEQQHTGQGEASWLREGWQGRELTWKLHREAFRGTSLTESSEGAAGGGERTQRNS